MSNVLIKNGSHMGPMWAVVKRYNIGNKDKYGKGIWISHNDLSKIKDCMMEDPTLLTEYTRMGHYIVMGTNIHNYVDLEDYKKLFQKEQGALV